MSLIQALISKLRNSHVLCLVLLPALSFAGAVDGAGTQDIATKTDSELTDLSARWAQLNPAERRALLAEVRQRMAEKRRIGARATQRAAAQAGPAGDNTSATVGGQASEKVVGKVTVERRYGRIVRKKDGSVVLQTRVVRRVAPNPAQQGAGRVTFGFGFERRADNAHVPNAQLSQPQPPTQERAPTLVAQDQVPSE